MQTDQWWSIRIKKIDSRQVFFSKNRNEYSNSISLNYNCKLSYVKSMIQELNKFARKSGTNEGPLFTSLGWITVQKAKNKHEPRVEQRQGVPKINTKLPERVLKILLTRSRVVSLQQHVVCFESDPGELCYRPKFLYMKELKKFEPFLHGRQGLPSMMGPDPVRLVLSCKH